MKRFWLFIGIGIVIEIVLLIVVIAVLNLPINQIYVAAFLGAWPVAAIAFYDRFVNVSLVSFDKKGWWKDSPLVINRGGVTWHYLRLPVKNSGFAPARNCTVELRVLERPQKNGESCPSPSLEPKALIWVAPRVEDRHTIPPRRGTAWLAIVIDDKSIAREARSGAVDNKVYKKWGPLTVWAGTNEVFTMSPATRAQDAFRKGDYKIELTVFPENGDPKTEIFKLHVDSDWNKTCLT
ncbi:MAG: hypothetical protein HY668_00665 [Chloroflexi bacterium]|nr:hypothetical protein [Chloroflexota bacterium]